LKNGLGSKNPEKAGVGGSTPALATIIPKNLAESRLAFSVRSQSAFRTRHKITCRTRMTLKNLPRMRFQLSPLSVR